MLYPLSYEGGGTSRGRGPVTTTLTISTGWHASCLAGLEGGRGPAFSDGSHGATVSK